MFCREQAYCHFSEALVRNLEAALECSMSAFSEPVIWSPAEQLPRAELRELQRERLLATFGVELARQLPELPFTGKRTFATRTRSDCFACPSRRSRACMRRAGHTASRPSSATPPPTSMPGPS